MAMLTKSKYIKGIQCHRLLWLDDRKKLPELSMSQKHTFQQGYIFEPFVKTLFPEGVELGDLDFEENIEETRKLIAQRKTVFEAGVQEGDFFIRADILEPSENGWNLFEIKASTEAKKVHVADLAFQKFVLKKSGINIARCFVLLLNKEYSKEGEINPKQMVSIEDVTDKVAKISHVTENATGCLNALCQEEAPAMRISKNCNKPYECVLKPTCWGTLPKNYVMQLTNWRLYWKLFDEGIMDIKDMDANLELADKDRIIKKAVDENRTIILKDKIRQFLESLNYPLYHFDFETFDTGVPIFDNSRPYQKIPFQYSLHIQQENGSVKHHDFLAENGDDPRPALLEAMKKVIGTSGDVIVYNKGFEVGVLRKLAEDFPEHKGWIENVLSRIVDLADPFRNFYYYNPAQKGSYSIKAVLPAVTGKGYDNLGIINGVDASIQFFNSHVTKELPNKEDIRNGLLEYCCLDTEGMVWIVEDLKKLV